jgi:hypothetical protein
MTSAIIYPLSLLPVAAAARLGMPSIALTPSEIAKPETAWMVDPDDRDKHRPMIVILARRMARLGVSRFVPDPETVCEDAEERRRPTPSGGDAA